MAIVITRAGGQKRFRITQFCCYKSFNLDKREGKLRQINSNYIYIRNLHLKTNSRVQNEWNKFLEQGRHGFLNHLATMFSNIQLNFNANSDQVRSAV